MFAVCFSRRESLAEEACSSISVYVYIWAKNSSTWKENFYYASYDSFLVKLPDVHIQKDLLKDDYSTIMFAALVIP